MNYIRKSDKQYPFSEFEIKALFPMISFGFPFVPPSDFAEVQTKDRPEYDSTSQALVEKAPKLYRGVYSQQWEVVDLDSDVIANNISSRMERLRNDFIASVQTHLDDEARSRGYDNILSACSYASSSVPKFKTEGKAAVLWRDQVWAYCYAQFDSIQAGTRAFPATTQSFLEELPTINW